MPPHFLSCGQKSEVENGDWGGKGLLTEARPPAKVIFPPPTPLAEEKAGSFSTFNAYLQWFYLYCRFVDCS